MFSRPDSSGWKPVAPDDAEHLAALHLEAHVTQGPDRGGLAAGAAMSDRTDGAAERGAQRPIAGGRLADAIALAEGDGAGGGGRLWEGGGGGGGGGGARHEPNWVDAGSAPKVFLRALPGCKDATKHEMAAYTCHREEPRAERGATRRAGARR